MVECRKVHGKCDDAICISKSKDGSYTIELCDVDSAYIEDIRLSKEDLLLLRDSIDDIVTAIDDY